MSTAQPTFGDIWRLFQETRLQFQKTERFLKEQAQETGSRFQKTDRRIKEVTMSMGDGVTFSAQGVVSSMQRSLQALSLC